MPAPKGNDYARKPDDQKRGDEFHVRAPAGLKGKVVGASRKENKKLTDWVIEAIEDKAAGEIPPYYTQAPTWTEVAEAMKKLDDHYLDVFGQRGIYAHHRITLEHPVADNRPDLTKGALKLTTTFTRWDEAVGTVVAVDIYLRPELVTRIRHGGEGHSPFQMRLDYPHA